MRLPFRVPSRKQLLEKISRALVPQFGPVTKESSLAKKVEDLAKEVDMIHMVVNHLTSTAPGPGWVETTQSAIIDIAQQLKYLNEGLREHHKVLEELKQTETMWRGGRVLNKPH